MVPSHLERAFFGMNCFLASEPHFGMTRGVWKTTVGYGNAPSGSEECIETVMVEYDSQTVSYGQLLEIFFLQLDSFWNPVSSACAPSVFVSNEFEKRLAQAASGRHECAEGANSSNIRVLVNKGFREASAICQKHFLRAFPQLMREVENFYPDEDSFIHSTLAARLNGALGLSSPLDRLPERIELYGLSDTALHELNRVLSCS
jgi:peptide-methionine (S)-S-oxide reductase